MRRIQVLSNKSISVKLEIKKEQGFFSDIVSLSSIFTDYLFNLHSDFDFVEAFQGYFFYFNENNIKLINDIFKNKKMFEDFENCLESEFQIKGKINSIKINSDISNNDHYIENFRILIEFKDEVFNIPSFLNLNEYVLNRYFYEFDYSKIFCSTNILITTNKHFIFKSKITIEQSTVIEDFNKLFKFDNTKFMIYYTPEKTVFEGDIYESDEDLQWIK